MGWLFGWDSKNEMQSEVRSRMQSGNYSLIAEKDTGENWWMVMKHPQGYHFIALYKMECGHDGVWGYKSMDESCGPVEVNCPLEFLDLAQDVPPSTYGEAWREKVRAFHGTRRRAM